MNDNDIRELWESLERAEKARAEAMPTEKDAIRVMYSAYTRLQELGWKDAIYSPKDGTMFDAISAGCTGIGDCFYMGDWPNGGWWIADVGDLWPARPILFRERPKPEQVATATNFEKARLDIRRADLNGVSLQHAASLPLVELTDYDCHLLAKESTHSFAKIRRIYPPHTETR